MKTHPHTTNVCTTPYIFYIPHHSATYAKAVHLFSSSTSRVQLQHNATQTCSSVRYWNWRKSSCHFQELCHCYTFIVTFKRCTSTFVRDQTTSSQRSWSSKKDPCSTHRAYREPYHMLHLVTLTHRTLTRNVKKTTAISILVSCIWALKEAYDTKRFKMCNTSRYVSETRWLCRKPRHDFCVNSFGWKQ